MKRAIFPALLIAVFLAVPAIPQAERGEDELAQKVEELTELVSLQDARIKALEGSLKAQRSAAAAMGKAIKFAEKKGFAYPAPNIDAREALLKGLIDYAKAVSGPAKTKK
jgi:hypothetical protein